MVPLPPSPRPPPPPTKPVCIYNATASLVCSSNSGIVVIGVVGSTIDTNLDPRKETIGDGVTNVDKLWERIEVVLSPDNAPHVVVVRSDGLCVFVVWGSRLNLGSELFGPEKLANMG